MAERRRLSNLTPEQREKRLHCIEKVHNSNVKRGALGKKKYSPQGVCNAQFFGTLRRRKGRRGAVESFFDTIEAALK